jgi:beta-lactamase class A
MSFEPSEQLVWDQLAAELGAQVAEFPGVVGVCVRDLNSGRQFGLRDEELFPTASSIKMCILAHLLERAERGELDLDAKFSVGSAQHVPGSGVLTYLDDEVLLSKRDVASLMIIVSDNTATNLCIDWATYEGVAEMLDRLGIKRTRLVRKMQDFAAVNRGDENLSTPADFVEFLSILHRAEKLSETVCAETLRILRKPKHGFLAPAMPDTVPLANKPGGMDRVRNDAGIVFLERRPYAVCIMSKFSTTTLVEQEKAVTEVAGVVYKYFDVLDRVSPWGQGLALTL